MAVKSANRRRSFLELTPDQERSLEGVAPGAGSALNDRLRRIGEQLEAACGLRGQVNVADHVHMEGHNVTEVADPVENADAVNFATLKRALQCDNLVAILQECWEYMDVLDDEVDAVAAQPALDYIIAARVYAPSTLTTQALGANINKAVAFAWTLPFDFRVSKVVIQNTAASAGKFFSAGIYSSGGSLLVDSGPQSATSATKKSVTLASAVTLKAGNYFLAWTQDASFNVSALTMTQIAQDFLNANKVRCGTGNASVAGQLPSTLGTLTTLGATLVQPIHMLLET